MRCSTDVLLQQTAEPGRAEDDDVVEALSPNRVDEPFDVCVLPQSVWRGKHFLHPLARAVTPTPSNA
jgi:hypothetical protein